MNDLNVSFIILIDEAIAFSNLCVGRQEIH